MAHDAKHKKSRKGGAAKMILIVLLILVLAAGGCLLAIRKEINGSASAGEPVSVSIQQGSGVAAIAQKLKTAGVIKYPHVFRWYAGKQGAAGKLQYGEFDLAPGSSYDDIIEALSAYAKADSVRLTFPEGTTAIAIAKKMEDAGLCSAEDFLKEANTGDFSQYRFWQYVPDDKDAPDRFLKCEMYAEMEQLGMTLSEVVTLASFVQEEAGNDQDDNVAQVFRNRLAEGSPYPKLQSNTSSYVQSDADNNYLWNWVAPYYGGWDSIPENILEAYDTYTRTYEELVGTKVHRPVFDYLSSKAPATMDAAIPMIVKTVVGLAVIVALIILLAKLL